MNGFIDLKSLSLDSLAGVVNLYPWFSAARKELCVRMNMMGGESWGLSQYADAALYLPSRKMVAALVGSSGKEDCSDEDVERLLKSYISERREENAGSSKKEGGRKVYVVGGDYFSQAQYDRVKGDTGFRFVAGDAAGVAAETAENGTGLNFYTETLAQIYAEQGYYEQAIEIYSKLILAYPEKNIYFAALIERLKEEIKK